MQVWNAKESVEIHVDTVFIVLQVSTCTQARTHARTHTHTHASTHARTHARTHMWASTKLRQTGVRKRWHMGGLDMGLGFRV